MPDLANIALSSVTHCSTLKPINESSDSAPAALFPSSVSTLPASSACDHNLSCPIEHDGEACYGGGVKRPKGGGQIDRPKKVGNGRCLEDHVRAWVEKNTEMGVPKSRCFLPFLIGAPKTVECLACRDFIHPGEEVSCSVRDCKGVYHSKCAKEMPGTSIVQRKFKCPQHVCFICKQRLHWRCVLCTMASHDKCAPWPGEVIHLKHLTGQAVCWRHPTDWRLDKQHSGPASGMEEIFGRLPLPYVDEEFKLNLTSKDMVENKMEPPSYVHIRRNVYLVKKKRDNADDGIGCRSCSTECSENCVCRVQCISCSKSCRCSEACTNRPFRKEKKIRTVKTELCGWGVEAAEPIRKGDFIIEYIGEVIDDALCERRLWDMKYRGVKNFYMCEIRKDFTIDATFKGNASRFLNHSCEPNCFLEKWQVEGETRVGVFAARSIKDGEQLTYDYRFVQFGPEVRCHCGAPSCQGFLGTKKKIGKVDLCWGVKRKRTSTACLAIMTL